jgi:alanine dehydrogenase
MTESAKLSAKGDRFCHERWITSHNLQEIAKRGLAECSAILTWLPRGSVMRIGVPKEIKVHEYRVGLVPAGVRELVSAGHEVLIETNAGAGIGVSDLQYQAAGAKIAAKAPDVFAWADMIVKVKEPQLAECKALGKGQILFTYLHLAADPDQARALMASGATAIAYETVTAVDGSLPLLTPMSEVAGRMSIQVGATCLQKANGGFGVLLGGVPGVSPAKVVVLGGGVAGTNAVEMAVGLRADVTVVDRSVKRLRELSALFGNQLKTAYSTAETVENLVTEADVVIGAVLIAGAAAPKLVTRAMVKKMKPGAVMVDISIDQGGCFETSRPTTHAEPTYVVDGVIHYCVTNMPGAVPRTSTFALTNATLPYVRAIADHGWQKALARDAGLSRGLNVHEGFITHEAVARDLGLAFQAYRAA